MIYVIGSGPAGVAAAAALVPKGLEVTMLDAGITLEEHRKKTIETLRKQDKTHWDPELIKTITENTTPTLSGVRYKSIFGSDFAYRGMDKYQPIKTENARILRSLAKGGLSNTWGASILPFCGEDLTDWPLTIAELDAHYGAVLKYVYQSARKDDLAVQFPLSRITGSFKLNHQTKSIIADLASNKSSLKKAGFTFGYSRISADPLGKKTGIACCLCGMCLYGCPYKTIYSTNETIDVFQKTYSNFKYYNNIIVDKIIEKNDGIAILTRDFNNKKSHVFRGEKAYLAAGVLSSTRILLSSLERFNYPIRIQHSDHYQLPMLRYRGTELNKEDYYTLSQLFLELKDEAICKNQIHMQLYGYNDFYERILDKYIKPISNIFPWVTKNFLSRIMVIKGYLHSNISSHISVYLEKDKPHRLVLKGVSNDNAKIALGKIKRKFIKNTLYFNAMPITVLAKIDAPGSGNHSGGSFPMKREPKELESDSLGRPVPFKKLFVVDSTVFTNIPATAITLNVMANAHRIASKSNE